MASEGEREVTQPDDEQFRDGGCGHYDGEAMEVVLRQQENNMQGDRQVLCLRGS